MALALYIVESSKGWSKATAFRLALLNAALKMLSREGR